MNKILVATIAGITMVGGIALAIMICRDKKIDKEILENESKIVRLMELFKDIDNVKNLTEDEVEELRNKILAI